MNKSENTIRIPNEIFFEEVKSNLASGENVSLRVTGNSMHPTFHHLKDIIVLSPCDAHNLQKGDVVLFDRGDTICVHRIIDRKSDTYIIRGDGNGIKALEYATPDKIFAKVTSGTMHAGRPFKIEDAAWRLNTAKVTRYAPLLAIWHRFTRILRSYPLSILVSLALLYLSLADMSLFKNLAGPGNLDKYVHALMYFCISSVYWLEWLRIHKAKKGCILKGSLFCVLLPILMGGIIEIVQEYCTATRKAELMDFVSDCIGVFSAALLALCLFFPIIRWWFRRHSAKAAAVLAVLLVLPFAADKAYAAPTVKPGIEVLQEMDFKPLEGKRVGLVTNPSGVDHKLRSTIDILHKAPNVNLVALFGPEHGVRGDVYAGGHVEDFTDPATGLPVHSLYGATRKPTAEMLKGIDVMVYDIQDVGVRCYTFISTLGLVMEACAPLGIEVMVLDRPNPLGGNKIEGCLVERKYNSFVSQYRIPFVYGLTPGEVALLINEEGLNCGQKGDQAPAKCKLTVIPMKGWTRDMTYDRTGLPWVLPSPNIPYAVTAQYYAASGMCGEVYNYLQVGLSYTLPFQTFAATWIDPEKFLAELQSYNLPGVSFRTIWYKPFAGSQAGKLVGGVQMAFTDWEACRVTEIQFYVVQALAKLYPAHLPFGENEKIGLYHKVSGTDYIHYTLAKTYKAADVLPYWRKDEQAFRELSSKYHLYK